MNDDELTQLLGPLDPTRDDPPPVAGSSRHAKILEHAMTTTLTPRPDTGDAVHEPVVALRRRPWANPRRLLAAAAVVVVLGLGLATLWPGGTQSAEAAVRSAAAELGEITSLRAEMTIVDEAGTSTAVGEFSGDNAHVVESWTDSDGLEHTSAFTVVDDTMWSESAGRIESSPVGPNDRLAPFGTASAAVLRAALTGSEVTDLGEAALDGTTVRHIQLTMTPESRAALAALTPAELAWFELEYPEEVQTIEVHLSGDIIHQLTVVGSTAGTRSIRYFDLGEPVTITAPQR
ncbi:MAG: hypothetical protein KDB21_02280 [Acidimicrobiales bacterium]|nr:hypothetical protein [Acidimicrobiales bacterium]